MNLIGWPLNPGSPESSYYNTSNVLLFFCCTGSSKYWSYLASALNYLLVKYFKVDSILILLNFHCIDPWIYLTVYFELGYQENNVYHTANNIRHAEDLSIEHLNGFGMRGQANFEGPCILHIHKVHSLHSIAFFLHGCSFLTSCSKVGWGGGHILTLDDKGGGRI